MIPKKYSSFLALRKLDDLNQANDLNFSVSDQNGQDISNEKMIDKSNLLYDLDVEAHNSSRWSLVTKNVDDINEEHSDALSLIYQ